MASSSLVSIQTQFTGDVNQTTVNAALENDSSPAENAIVTLASGANTILPPSVSGIVVSGLTIIPPVGNTNLITLKGVTGDTGIPLHLTNPSYIPLDTSFTSLVLNAAGTIVGARLIWS